MLSFVFAVSPTSPFKSLEEVAVDAKRDPGNFTWTSLGGASTHDFAFRQFFKAIGVDVSKTKAIMSQGGSQAVTLTAGGHVKLGGGTTPSCFAGIKGGIIRPLAITSRTRYPDLSEVPTTAEQGYPTVNAQAWFGPSGPPNLPAHIVGIWEKASQELAKDPEVISKWRNVGAVPFYLNARDAREYVMKEVSEMKELWGIK
jgi:tripartite-type tricarboxylate transporter receptor subunit TctC